MKIVITGGTGSLGSALVAKWYSEHRLTVVSRNSHNQAALRGQYPNLEFYQADIGNADNLPVLRKAFEGRDLLIHAAAEKVVSEGQYHPLQFVATNIVGTTNVATTWVEVGNGPAIAISSDKARAALTTYGATKKITEGIFRYFGLSALCYGNVVTSRGSFLTVWKERVAQGQPIQVVPDATRFFMTMADATNLVDEVANYLGNALQDSNGIFIPTNLKAFRVGDVAEATGLKWAEVAMGSYEKQHEVLLEPGMKVDQITELFGRIVVPYNPDDDYYNPFRSNTCERMTGIEVLEAAKWNL